MWPMLLMLMHVGALGCSFKFCINRMFGLVKLKVSCGLCISLNFHFTWCELLVRPSCCSTAGVPDVLKDLLLFILLIKGVVCNLQTARAGIIFSISSALLLIPLWGLFSGANPPAQPGDRCTCHHGDTVARETHVSERSTGWDGMSRGRWGSEVTVIRFTVTAERVSLLLFHHQRFNSVVCAGVKS